MLYAFHLCALGLLLVWLAQNALGADPGRVRGSVESLQSPRPDVFLPALEELSKAGPGIVPELIRGMKSHLRGRTQRVLLRIGPGAVPWLVELTKDPELRTRAGGLLATVIGPESADQAPALLECIRSRPQARNYCGQALVKAMSPRAGGQVRTIAAALKDPEADVRVYAAAALGQIGFQARQAVPALARALKDPDPAVRRSAVLALGRLRGTVREAREALEKALSDPESGRMTRQALEGLDG